MEQVKVCTIKFLSRRPASAKSNVVFPELGGPKSSVNLKDKNTSGDSKYNSWTRDTLHWSSNRTLMAVENHLCCLG